MARIEVEWFAQEMDRKLKLNDHKGHWSNCTNKYLLTRLRQELRELEVALQRLSEESEYSRIPVSGHTIQIVIDEAADVANFAMMVADNAKKFLG